MKAVLPVLFLLVFLTNSFAKDNIIIAKNPITWIKPDMGSYRASANQTMELAFNTNVQTELQVKNFVLNKNGDKLNPFNPEDIDVIGTFNAPSGKQFKGIGFYFQDFMEDKRNDVFEAINTVNPWRMRFAPDEIGQWTVQIEIKIKNQERSILHTTSFQCIASEHKGRLITLHTGTDADRNLYYEQSGERFITTGMNISSGGFFSYKPSQKNRQIEGVNKLAAVHGNFVRFEIGAQSALPDWYDIFNYQSKQDEMFAFDQTLEAAEQNKIYAIFFRHHVEIKGDAWDIPNWKNNPYRKHFNFQNISEYYTNQEAIKLQKMNLRYMYARWGYSPYWSFYGYSEIEKFIDPMIEEENLSDAEGIDIFKNWFVDQKEYILKELNPKALFANSYGVMKKEEKNKGYDGVLNASDVSSIHIYSTIKDGNFGNRAEAVDDFWKYYKQPVILEEIGINNDKLAIYCCTGIEFHNSIWSSALMGSAGTGLDWWWDRGVMDFSYEQSLKPLQEFLVPLQNENKNFIPQRWADARENSRMVESYTLVADDKKEAYGWLHNASYYWRNEAVNSECLQGLLDSSNVAMHCVVGQNVTIGRNESPRDYASDRHKDKFTDKGGVQPITAGLDENPIFKIDDLQKGSGKNRIWYKVEFFSTRPNESLKALPEYTQILRTRIGKTLKVIVPNLDDKNPDVAYRITLVGTGKSAPKL